MFSDNLKNWQIFNTLESEYIQSIRVAAVFGSSGDKAIIATYNNMVYILGLNVNKVLGKSDIMPAFSPAKISELCGKDIKTFVCSNDFIFALTNNGLVYPWRYSEYVKHGYQSATVLQATVSNRFILDIACGDDHFLQLTNEGKVHLWQNPTNASSVLTQVDCKLTNKIITCISCGKDFSIVVTDKGEVYGWGKNTCGQLGTKSYNDEKIPFKVTELDGIVIEKVVCGYSHTLALSTMGVLYVWGENSCGQLGLNTRTNVFVPVQLKATEMGKVWDVAACSACHISAAIVENNQVFIWGHCMGHNILAPTRTLLKCLHDVFAYYAWPKVTYQSLIFYDERNSNFVTSISKGFDDPVTSDFTIKVQEKSIYVHKAVLKIRCQYYRTMFQEFWVENSQSVVQYDQYSYDVYKAFFKYLYTNEIDLFSDSEIVELLSLANMRFMSQLKNRCSEILRKKVTIENVVYLYSMSVKYNSKELQKYLFKFALNHMTAVVQIPDFIQLDKDIITDFLIQAAKAGAFKT